MDELFAYVKDMNGNEMEIVRHNGVEELNHRWSRMHIRRRTGSRSRTTIEMEKYGALLAVFLNIEMKNINDVLNDVIDFVRNGGRDSGREKTDSDFSSESNDKV